MLGDVFSVQAEVRVNSNATKIVVGVSLRAMEEEAPRELTPTRVAAIGFLEVIPNGKVESSRSDFVRLVG